MWTKYEYFSQQEIFCLCDYGWLLFCSLLTVTEQNQYRTHSTSSFNSIRHTPRHKTLFIFISEWRPRIICMDYGLLRLAKSKEPVVWSLPQDSTAVECSKGKGLIKLYIEKKTHKTSPEIEWTVPIWFSLQNRIYTHCDQKVNLHERLYAKYPLNGSDQSYGANIKQFGITVCVCGG